MRERGDEALVSCGCCHGTNVTLGRVCDGVPEVRRAARDELRKGASQIKIMASGGVASPTDRLSNLQVSRTAQPSSQGLQTATRFRISEH